MMSPFSAWVLHRARRLALPILTYPGASLIGARVRDLVTNADTQAAAQLALQERFHLDVLLTAMDLSAEAEAFGAEVVLPEHEVPTVIGRLAASSAAVEALRVPTPGEKRTGVYLETARRLSAVEPKRPVLAGLLGPFSLAARLYGVSEALGLTIEDSGLTHALLERSTQFLVAYASAFKAVGASGVIMAEPTAGLLSPKAMAEFSSAYVHRVVEAVDDDSFTVILHNCAARSLHLPAVLAAGTRAVHFGAPMDLPAALAQAPPDRLVCGNIDPARVFVHGTPSEMRTAVRELDTRAAAQRNFVLSSGCDVPPQTPLANIQAFFDAAYEDSKSTS